MVNGDLSHSTWLAPQLDELSLLQAPCSISSISHNASAHITAAAPQSRWGVGGSVIRCHIALVTLNKKDERGKGACEHFVLCIFSAIIVWMDGKINMWLHWINRRKRWEANDLKTIMVNMLCCRTVALLRNMQNQWYQKHKSRSKYL